MITNERKDLFVRLVADGQNNIEQLNKCGFDTGTIKYLCSPAHKDVLNPAGENRLYKLKQADKEYDFMKWQLIFMGIAAAGAIASAILLAIQTFSPPG